ncbi:alpha-galactosidase [Streptococcus merionis]|uniref:alpha-galactosidase n=1 Tax=Streptococcus merionis TaxID=400065 RepID=UPI00351199DF
MTLKITFDQKEQLFHLTNGKMSYIMELVDQSYLAHCYWGRYLKGYRKQNQVPFYKKTFAAFPSLEKPEFSLEFLPLEFPQAYHGDYRQSAIVACQDNGEDMLRLVYKNHRIFDGVPTIPDLPQARKNVTDKAKTLIVKLFDEIAHVEVELFYTLFEHSNGLIRSSKVTNLGEQRLTIQQLASASVDMFYQEQIITTLYGSHQKEFQIHRQKISHGQFKTGTTRGASGPQYVPFIAISEQSSEYSGDVHAMSLIYSGNHCELVERDQYDQLRLQIGINSEQFAWTLNYRESFYSPQAILVYSPDGYNGMSQEFHNFSNSHLVSPQFRDFNAPILINSWEMTYFDVNESKMLALVDKATELGFEAIVLDDGWFQGRDDSKSSLGDWVVDREKFPSDLSRIVEKTRQSGLKFGIWFEPEMISPNSKLIKEKPEWVMKSSQYPALYGRNQLILDLAQKDVQDFLIEMLSQFIKRYRIDYIKWDMNRHISDPFSQRPTGQHPKAYSHLYILGLYRIIDRLTSLFPQVLFENCSSGGGRFDFGMLYYFPQTWTSDNTDGFDRQEIQYGASYLFHPYQMTGHISTIPNHQTNRETPLKTRENLASSTNMGYELDILQFEEIEDLSTKEHINRYKLDREWLKSSTFYRLASPSNGNLCAWLFESKDKSRYSLVAFRNRFQVNEHQHILKLPYLNPELNYFIEEKQLIVSGSEITYSGLYLDFEKQDWDSITLHLSKV